MDSSGVKFIKYRCFISSLSGFDEIKHVNIIIGKNNSGKSCLLDLVEMISKNSDINNDSDTEFYYNSILKEGDLKRVFQPGMSHNGLYGDHWHNHGVHYIDKKVEWMRGRGERIFNVNVFDAPYISTNKEEERDYNRYLAISRALSSKRHFLSEKIIRRINAERDIAMEEYNESLYLSPDGAGATNIIQRYINDFELPREVIQRDLLVSLNSIFGDDANFTEIQVQSYANKKWEVFLGESSKGIIPLSKSGSGLKTVLLVLLNLLTVPMIERKKPSDYVFLFEELENNLHPALQRRLLKYIEYFSINNDCYFFITTHSNVCLDVFASSKNSTITRVIHDGQKAKTTYIGSFFDKIDVIHDIGAKASDLLQSNGIVWLEGPSDRIYFNKWVELVSEGKLKEGIDYQCAFYGGALLARHTAVDPDASLDDKVNILRVNHNAVVVCDGDRTAKDGKGSRIKGRVAILKKQIEGINKGHIWITDAKEIESYIPSTVLRNIWNSPGLKQIDQYCPFWREPKGKDTKKGYFQMYSPKSTVDKVDLALKVVPHLTLENLGGIFEWKREMEEIVNIISSWGE